MNSTSPRPITLLELVISIALVGMIAAVLIPSLSQEIKQPPARKPITRVTPAEKAYHSGQPIEVGDGVWYIPVTSLTNAIESFNRLNTNDSYIHAIVTVENSLDRIPIAAIDRDIAKYGLTKGFFIWDKARPR